MTSETPLDGETMQLVQQARQGRGQAFEQLFDRHRTYLSKVVGLRLDAAIRARVDPADVIQDAYLEAHRRFPDYVQSPQLPFRLWLRQIACDEAMKAHRRHRQTAKRSVDREIELPEQSSILLAKRLQGMLSSPSQKLQRKETARLLRDAIDELPSHEREVVIMRHYEGLSNQEIGILLDVEPATVSKRHGRAILRLHEILFDSQD